MMDPGDAREALGEVHARGEQTATELARARPPWWHTGLLLGGYYLAIAGAGLDPPFLAPVGFALIAVGIAVTARTARRVAVQRPRRYWTVPRVLILGAAMLCMFVARSTARQLLFAVVDDSRFVAFLAPVPSAAVFAVLIAWMYRGYYPRRAVDDGQSQG